MAYTPTSWVDSPSTTTPISAANLNHMEAGIAAAYIAGTGGLVNADIASGAAIAYSKLALTGSILNADLAGSIAYAKLALTGAILNADLAGNIAITKLASYPTDGTKALFGDASWKTLVGTSSASGAGALQDLASPTETAHYHIVSAAGGGSIRSVGIPALGAGSKFSIRVAVGTVTIKHGTAGGTGQQFYTRTTADVALASNETMDFLYDGSLWVEQSRDQATVASGTQGTELGYTEFTSTVTMTPPLTEGASSQVVVTSAAITFDGAPVLMEFWCPIAVSGSGGMTTILYDNTGTASLGWLANQGVNNTVNGLRVARRFTPAAGSRTYSVRSFFASGGAGTYQAGVGGSGVLFPGYIRFTKV